MVTLADAVVHARIVRVEVVDSTQRLAFELAGGGAADGTVVVADHQTAGRGRRGRAWQAAARTSLLMSLVIRPRLAAHETPRLSFVAAIAVAEAIEDLTRGLTGVTPRLKWPNDVLLAGRKVAGILLESRAVASLVVIGIGVNVRQTGFPAVLGDGAISVRAATGIDLDRDRLLVAVLDRFDHWRARIEQEGFAPVRERWLTLADTIGRTVHVDGVVGRAVDLAADGALVIDDGTSEHRVLSGDIVTGASQTPAETGHDAPRR
jgi:BirA family biotin operon repressor/biotin-[acetyl-CoA-carboxylase] ligase